MNDSMRAIRIFTYHSAANENQASLAVGATRLHQIRGILADASIVADRFVQVHDSAVALAGGEQAVWEMLVPGASTVAGQFAEAGDDFEPIAGFRLVNGLVLAASTTTKVFTAPAQPEFVFLASFERIV